MEEGNDTEGPLGDDETQELVGASGGLHTANPDGSPAAGTTHPSEEIHMTHGAPSGPLNPPVDPNTLKRTTPQE